MKEKLTGKLSNSRKCDVAISVSKESSVSHYDSDKQGTTACILRLSDCKVQNNFLDWSQPSSLVN